MSTLSTTNIKHPNSASNNVVLDSSGRVGIGEASPNRQLVVNGGGSEGVIQITNNTSGTAAANGFELIHFTNGETQLLNRENGAMRFDTNGTERMRITSGGDLQFNSGYGSVATAYGCRAWVNFNGTSTVAIRASGNVSSITDNGAGDYTVNFTTAMPDANYAVAGSAQYDAATNSMYLAIGQSSGASTYSTTAVRVRSVSFSNGGDFDCNIVNCMIFR